MNQVTRNTLSRHTLSLAIGGILTLSASATFAADADRQVADGTVVTVPAGSIETDGDYAHALEAINGGTIIATATDLVTQGYRAEGIFADGAGSAVSLDGGSIGVDGVDASGGLARNGGALNIDGTAITVSGNVVHGMAAFSGGQVTVRNSTIDASGRTAHGVDARDAGSHLQISDSAIHMTGDNASGMFVDAGGLISAERVAVQTEGNSSNGVLLGNGTLQMRDSSIHTDGDYGSGVLATTGALADLSNTTVTTTGNFNYGLYSGGSSTINASGVDISTSGTSAIGVLANGTDGIVAFNGGSIQTTGTSSDGARVSNGGHLQLGRDASGNGTLIQVSGDNARGAWVDAGTARIDGASIQIDGGRGTGIVGAAGVVTSHGGDALVTNTTITTTGYWGDGVDVEGDSSMTVLDSSIHTTGDDAKGAVAYDDNASLVLDNVSIRTDGATARGVVASGLATNVAMRGGSITTTGAGSKGAQAVSAAALQLSQLSIDASGTGVQAADASRVDMSDVSVLTHEGYAHGVEATGSDARVTGSNVRSTTEGEHAYGLRANNGGQVDLDQVTIATGGVYAHGVVADTVGSSLKVGHAEISTASDVSMGARAVDGGLVELSAARLTTRGNGAYGLEAMGGGSVLRADNVSVETFGTTFGGTTASAVVAEWGGQLDISNANLTTHGVSSIGLLSQVGGSLGDPDTVLNANQVQVLTNGENAFGAMACALVVGAGDACASPTHSGMASDGARALLNITDSSLHTTGTGSHGLYAYGPAGAALTASGSQVLTTGNGAHGAVAEFGAELQLIDSQVRAEGAGAVGADVIGSTLGMAGGTLYSGHDSAIRSEGGDITLTAAAQVGAGNGTFLEQVGDDASLVRMQDRAVAVGDIVFGSGASTAATTLQLSGDSAWVGKTSGVLEDLSIASGARWQMTGDSQVGRLSLDHGIVAFDAPATGDFKTLTVNGDFTANNGLLLMNTALGDDHSATDKLHVLGNTSGTAAVAVNNVGGLGGETQDGIQIIQVDGRSDARFDLAGRAVGGMYEYFLYQGGKTDPNDGDWYLRSELDSATDPAPQPCLTDPAAPGCGGGIIKPVLRPEAGAYLANQAAAVGMFQHAMHDRLGEPNLVERLRRDDVRGSSWARIEGGQTQQRTGLDQLDVRSDRSMLQIGTDLARWGEQGRGQVGVMMAAGKSSSSVLSNATGYQAQGRVDGTALGIYGNWFAHPAQGTGLYVDSWVQAGDYRQRVQGQALAEERLRARSLTGSVEAGYAWLARSSERSRLLVEPQLQLTYTDYRSDDHAEANGTRIETALAGGLTTRLGVRAYGHANVDSGNRVQPFVTANWYHQQRGNAVSFNGDAINGAAPQDRYELKAGAQLQLGGKWTGWGQLGVQRGDGSFRDVAAQLGLKRAW
ncbi:autotransporter outer membrane beta-barrel domain-containing protein [Stenotrophomonas rhizophila]|uniref:autotransporter outer membrane beta-barrel domain-containing protein n=1 Tax=Stenotrophomonas rhizophila TaxID=216778 RepID=UPI001E480E96|nr:autotransporter outer membrane beta-barrel domain-containing protein [Stenotrophomonas rhizophila]MCC7634828.1 autotransporter outer membrane beta-barrel domain-containing protein [Stenotrophomonas rhizophila]MCC7664499.1 autotransporter outer membrane beta-barrel domain-containing protein [Stenotrophomonas rhizophila]